MQMHRPRNALHLLLQVHLQIKIKIYRRTNRGGLFILWKTRQLQIRQHVRLWMMTMDRKPIEFRQMCAVVRAVIQRTPTIDDAEWKAKTLEVLAAMQFQEPPADMLDRAMTQVEFAVRRTLGPRPTTLIATPLAPPVHRFEGRTNRPAGWDLVQRMLQRLQRSSTDCEPSAAGAQAPREVLPLSEVEVVTEFWAQVQQPEADRLALLLAFAEIAIVQPGTWTPEQIRAEFEASAEPTVDWPCFGCASDRPGRAWHHVIQIQHGGSNYARNRVILCELCHTAVHPWLGSVSRRRSAWVSLADMVGKVRRKTGTG